METKKRRKVIKYSIIAIVVLIVAYHLGWIIYHKPAFHGRVIDAETKEPIEGAVVVAVYNASAPAWPGGSNTIRIGVQETLTGKTGEFHIPPYTTIMLPFWLKSDARFVIYKPGYGSYPDYHVSPPSPGVEPEEFFLGELGTEGEVEWLSQKIKVTFGVVEMPRLRTWEERRKAQPGLPSGVNEKQLPLLHRAISEEDGWIWGNKGWKR